MLCHRHGLAGSSPAAGVDLGLNPFTTPWLAAKLLVCIGLGSLALKRARTRARRAWAFGAALLCFAAMLAIARLHDPWGFLAAAYVA